MRAVSVGFKPCDGSEAHTHARAVLWSAFCAAAHMRIMRAWLHYEHATATELVPLLLLHHVGTCSKDLAGDDATSSYVVVTTVCQVPRCAWLCTARARRTHSKLKCCVVIRVRGFPALL